jgi:PEP-CTERM motif
MMMRFYSLLAGLILTCGAQVQASNMIYTMSGGTFSGSLNGVSFTSATYSITATADPANVQTGNYLGYPLYTLLATPSITINGFAPATLTASDWKVMSLDLNNSQPGASVVSFSQYLANTPDFELFFLNGSGLYNNFSTSASYNQANFAVSSGSNSLATSAGALLVTANTATGTGVGSFTVVAVPEPSTYALTAIATGVMAYLARRRKAKLA